MGVINNGLVYALYDYEPNPLVEDELEFKDGDKLIILRRGDDNESQWWWAKHENTGKEGYIPRNYLGVSDYERITFRKFYCLLDLSTSTTGFNAIDKLLMPSFNFL